MTAQDIIQQLVLVPHPEGGYYKETYRSEEEMETKDGKTRNVSTAIYFLLEQENKSHFHRIKSDELWFFHQGEPLEILFIEDGKLQSIILGNDITKGAVPQAKVKANTWFASHVKDEKGYALVSCTVAPGFDFADFEMANKHELLKEFPHLETVIENFSL